MHGGKALAKGSEFPKYDAEKPVRIYSSRICPFAQRTQIVLNLLNIPHETINVHLKEKPEWFLERTPLALVPVLEEHGENKIVYESSICNEYLSEKFGADRLMPTDPYQRARIRMRMDNFKKMTEPFLKLFRSNDDLIPTLVTELKAALKGIDLEIVGPFATGEKMTLLDVHIWPFMERIPVVEQLRKVSIISNGEFPKLSSWIKTMDSEPAVNSTNFGVDAHVKFMASYFAGKPDYDIGL